MLIPRDSDLREMKENIERAQLRGTVDHFAAERLRHVIEAFEDFDTAREALSAAIGDLEGTVDNFETDADDFMVDIDGTLDDLGLPPDVRKAIDDALATENKRQSGRLRAEINEICEQLKKHVETLTDLVEGDE